VFHPQLHKKKKKKKEEEEKKRKKIQWAWCPH
jgi:hypothetical protein